MLLSIPCQHSAEEKHLTALTDPSSAYGHPRVPAGENDVCGWGHARGCVLLPLERGFFLSGISQNIRALWIPPELLVFGVVVFCLFVFLVL